MLIITLIIMGLIFRKKYSTYILITFLYVISTPIFANIFLRYIEGDRYVRLNKIIEKADAIVVLSGMIEFNKIDNINYIEWGDPDRFFGGIELFKSKKANILIFTGGKLPWNKTEINEGQILKKYAINFGIDSNKIKVTEDVTNTAAEAVATRKLLKSKIKNIILVTSAFHMYRAKTQFEKAGFNVQEYRVDYKSKLNKEISFIDFLPTAESLNLIEIGVKDLLGRVYYYLKE